MKTISEIDKNLAAEAIVREGMRFYDINRPPFCLYGCCREVGEEDFKRLPHALAAQIDTDLKYLYTHTAGIRLRFKTDSRKILIRCQWPGQGTMDHMPFTGSSAFDLYANGRYVNVFRPAQSDLPLSEGYESSMTFGSAEMRDIVIGFPLYNNVSSFMLALEEGAQVLPGDAYADPLPVVYYGSSITQGGCASHPGNSYEAMISRRMDMDYMNLGFSGNCKAEVAMAEYIAGLKMRAFVYDYDHNSPSAEHLAETHERLFKILREKQPQLPVLIVSAADGGYGADDARRDVIRRTYENALTAGDAHVRFLDGRRIYADVGLDDCTVDGCHPNDLGFWCMANAIESELRRLLDI